MNSSKRNGSDENDTVLFLNESEEHMSVQRVQRVYVPISDMARSCLFRPPPPPQPRALWVWDFFPTAQTHSLSGTHSGKTAVMDPIASLAHWGRIGSLAEGEIVLANDVEKKTQEGMDRDVITMNSIPIASASLLSRLMGPPNYSNRTRRLLERSRMLSR